MYYANILDSQVEDMKERIGQLNLSEVRVKTDTKNNKRQEQNDNQSNDQQQSKQKICQ